MADGVYVHLAQQSSQVQEKFKLDLSDEEAIRAFEDMLNETSYITLMLDRLHDAAQFFRS